MAEIRCPMCGKPNSDTNVECQHCGSRLKPLRISDDPEQPAAPPTRQPPAESRPAVNSNVTLIRRSLRDRVEPPAPPEEEDEEDESEQPTANDVTLMRRSLRERFDAPAPPEEEKPKAEPPAASADVTLLRSSLRSSWQPPAEAEPEKPKTEPEAGGGEGTPAWLDRLRTQSGTSALEPRSPSRPTPPTPPAPPPAEPSRPARRETPPAQPETGRRRTTGELFKSLRTAALRPETAPEPEEPEVEAEATDDVPDWLGALRKQSVTAPIPEPPARPAPAPEPEAEAEPEPAAGMPDWLRSLRQQSTEPEGDEPSASVPTSAPKEAAPADEPETENLDWMSQARAWETPETAAWPPVVAPETPAEPADDFPDWLKSMEAAPPAAVTPAAAEDFASAGQAAPADELPDWLSSLGNTPAEPAAAAEAAPAEDYPDWLRSLAEAPPAAPGKPEAAPAEPAGDLPEWLTSVPGADTPASAEEGTGLPDWLDSLPPTQFGQPAEAAPAAPPETPEAEPAVEAGLPDWLASLRSEPAVTETPETPYSGADLDFLTLSPEPAEQSPAAAAPSVEAEVELPDWLSAMRPAAGEPDVAAPGVTVPEPPSPSATPTLPFVGGEASLAALDQSNLERATLPSWLEAMRPLPTSQTGSTTSSEYEETTGPLAGMKGVIAAEPAIALPTVRLATATQPTVSETHLAQVKMIQALVKEETAARPAPRGAGARPLLAVFERWLIFAIIAVAVVAPFVLGDAMPQFGPPKLFPVEAVAARDVVANLPANRPVLVAFEYDPGAAGEMDSLSAALLQHLAARGLSVVTVSTRPLGPALAQSALEAAWPVEAGESAQGRYVNLGYLPGGVLSLPAFAADPRSLVASGFITEAADPDVPTPGLWQQPALLGVRSLADFGLIAVVSNSPDSVRAWIEQAEIIRRGAGGMLNPPMIALVSASAEPLVQPYYLAENTASSLQGLVSGQFGAASYEQLSGEAPLTLPNDIKAQRWNAQSLGLIAALIIIGAGALLFGSFSLLQRRGERAP